MKILAVLTMVLFTGFAVHGQADRQGEPKAEGKRPDPVARRDQTIRKLVEESDLIVLGSVTKIYDGTARDGGMSYDVKIETALYGKDVPSETLRFRSAGWVEYARYAENEKVLLFLKRWQKELLQLRPVSYLQKSEHASDAVTLAPLQDCLEIIKAEIQKRKNADDARATPAR